MRGWAAVLAVLAVLAALVAGDAHHHSHQHAHHHHHHNHDGIAHEVFNGLQVSHGNDKDREMELEQRLDGDDSEDQYYHHRHHGHDEDHGGSEAHRGDFEEDTYAASFEPKHSVGADGTDPWAPSPHQRRGGGLDEQVLAVNAPSIDSIGADYKGPPPAGFRTDGRVPGEDEEGGGDGGDGGSGGGGGKAAVANGRHAASPASSRPPDDLPMGSAMPDMKNTGATSEQDDNEDDVFESLPNLVVKPDDGGGAISAKTKSGKLRLGDRSDQRTQPHYDTGAVKVARTTRLGAADVPSGERDTEEEDPRQFYTTKKRDYSEAVDEHTRLANSAGEDSDADGGDEDHENMGDPNDLLAPRSLPQQQQQQQQPGMVMAVAPQLAQQTMVQLPMAQQPQPQAFMVQGPNGAMQMMQMVPVPAPQLVDDPVTQRLPRRHKKPTENTRLRPPPQQRAGGQARERDLEAQNLLSTIASAMGSPGGPSSSSSSLPPSSAGGAGAIQQFLSKGSVDEGLENLLSISKTGEPKDMSANGLASVLKALASAAMVSDAGTAKQMGASSKDDTLKTLQTLVQLGTGTGTGTGTGAGAGNGAGNGAQLSSYSFNPLAAMLLPLFQGWIGNLVGPMVPRPFDTITKQAFGAWKPKEDKTYMVAPPVQAPPFNPRPASPPPLFPMPQRQRMDEVEAALMAGQQPPGYKSETTDPRYEYFQEIRPKPDKLWEQYRSAGAKAPEGPFTPSVLPDSDQMQAFPRSGPVAPQKAPFFNDMGDPRENQRNPASIDFPYPGIYLQLDATDFTGI